MSNLLDFVTIETSITPSPEPAKDIKQMHADFEAIRVSARKLVDSDMAFKMLSKAADTVNKKQLAIRKAAFHQDFALPEELHEFNELSVSDYGDNYYDSDGNYRYYPRVTKTKHYDKLSMLAATPTSTVSSMMKLADAFSMAIVPFSYLNKRAYASESLQM